MSCDKCKDSGIVPAPEDSCAGDYCDCQKGMDFKAQIESRKPMRKVEFVQSGYDGGFPDSSGTFKHGEPLWLVTKEDMEKLENFSFDSATVVNQMIEAMEKMDIRYRFLLAQQPNFPDKADEDALDAVNAYLNPDRLGQVQMLMEQKLQYKKLGICQYCDNKRMLKLAPDEPEEPCPYCTFKKAPCEECEDTGFVPMGPPFRASMPCKKCKKGRSHVHKV